MAKGAIYKISPGEAAPRKLRKLYEEYLAECEEQSVGFVDVEQWFTSTFKVKAVRDNDGYLIGFKFKDDEELTAFLISWCT